MASEGHDGTGWQTVEVLGVTMHVLPTAALAAHVAEAVAAGRRLVVGNHNLHSVYLVRERPDVRRFYDGADLVFVDGMSLVAAAKLTGRPIAREHRSTPLDWFEPMLRLVPAGTRVFLLGSQPGLVDETMRVLRENHPTLTFSGRHGYFGTAGEENESVLQEIRDSGAGLLLVGMGMPRQELWLADNADRTGVPVMLAVGGLFDYFNGSAGTPPRWMGRVGLEWLYRLADDPRRLAHRYLVEPFLLARLLLRDRRR